MAIGMQQKTAPTAISAKTRFAGQPKTRLAAVEPCGSWPLANEGSGPARRKIAANGAMMRNWQTPNHSMVCRQPA